LINRFIYLRVQAQGLELKLFPQAQQARLEVLVVMRGLYLPQSAL
jgi:hypothetical protein